MNTRFGFHKSKSNKSVFSDHTGVGMNGGGGLQAVSSFGNGTLTHGLALHNGLYTSHGTHFHGLSSGSLQLWEHNPNNLRILFVGEKFTSGAVTLALEKVGYTVTQIESHTQAIEIMGEQHSYKVVCVYSAGNPVISQFITRMKQVSGIPIIVIASGGGVESTAKYLKAGASDCIYTPVCSELLKIRISCILENLQMRESFKIPIPAIVPQFTTQGDGEHEKSDSRVKIDELKSTIAQLEQRISWADAELLRKDTEISSLQQQLSAVSWRSSLLESEKHKGETLSQALSQKDKELDDLRKHMSRALETPIQVITRTLAQFSNGHLDQNQLRNAFATLVQCVSSTSQMYQPAITKSQFLSSLNLDEMTRQWLLYEFTTGGLDTPPPQPPPTPSLVPITPSLPPPGSPRLAETSSSHSQPPQSSPPPSQNQPRVITEISKWEGKARSPRNLSVVVPTTPPQQSSMPVLNSPPTPPSGMRTLKSGRSVDDILKRKQTTDMQTINTYNCNPWMFDVEEVALLTWNMFDDLGLVEQFKIPQLQFFQLIESLKANYLANPYHNFQHAFDICQTCYMFVKTCNLRQYMTQMDIFAMLVAALCHDIDHPGLNNTFQINSKSPLSVLYNDLSVLENHHCARAFYLLNDPKNNILSGLSTAEYKEFRRTVVSAILATDMTTHFELLTRFTTHLDARPFSIENKDDRQLIVDILLHSADISNTCKPFVISKRWSDLLLEEFLNQGDLEKEFALPVSPFMDRHSTDHVRMTLNFMDYMVAPLCASLAKLFTGMRPLLENLQLNRAQWAEKALEPVKVPKSSLEPEKPERQENSNAPSTSNAGKVKRGTSRSFIMTRTGYDMLQKGSAPPTSTKRLSLEAPRGLDFKKSPLLPLPTNLSSFSPPLTFSSASPPQSHIENKLKLSLPKLATNATLNN